ncbi:serine/threonine protein kinase [Fusarium austroafricanum]|uniref:Serine/threonine protein kinase n=1 Tax=Fusarium austroafricanum TaxID=2364996 RepID=A0A8H4KHY5_9HYPO|nr:serine/threonine protein kinase [Fusarium austroafricanum]
MWAIGISLLGMMSQWPPCPKKEERMYPRKCASHARTLDKMNPDHEIVQVLMRLLEWDPKKRITAPELAKLTTELLEARTEATPVNMDLHTPEGVAVLQFW